MGLERTVFSTFDTSTATYVKQVAERDFEVAIWDTYDSHKIEDDFEIDHILMNLASEKIKEAAEE